MRALNSILLASFLLVLTSFTFTGNNTSTTTQYTEYGIASFYSDLFEGRNTASGEPYVKSKMTAAHKSLPYGTIVKVIRLDNKKSIQVKINDRGAFNKGRIIDLSKAAAKQLGMLEDGKANVKIVVLQEGKGKTQAITAINESPKKVAVNEKPSPKKAKKAKVINKKVTKKKKTYHIKGKEKKAKSSKKAESLEIVTSKNYKEFDLYKVQVLRPKKEGFGVQVGLLKNYENVFKFVADLQDDFFKNILLSVEQGKAGPVYRVVLGPFPTKDQAQSYRNSLSKKKKIEGFVIGLENLAKTE